MCLKSCDKIISCCILENQRMQNTRFFGWHMTLQRKTHPGAGQQQLNPDDQRSIGLDIMRRREAANLPRTDLANKIGISERTLFRWEMEGTTMRNRDRFLEALSSMVYAPGGNQPRCSSRARNCVGQPPPIWRQNYKNVPALWITTLGWLKTSKTVYAKTGWSITFHPGSRPHDAILYGYRRRYLLA